MKRGKNTVKDSRPLVPFVSLPELQAKNPSELLETVRNRLHQIEPVP
jgi:hypothetical protein